MSTLAVLPVIVPLAAGAISVALWKSLRAQRVIAVVATLLLVVVSLMLVREVSANGIVVMHMGGWPAPLGITFVVDLFGSMMALLASIIGAATALYSLKGIDRRRQSFLYFPLLHVLLMGVCGAFLTGDIFNLYVWFEVLLMSSFVLLALGNERAQLEGAIKYVTLNLMSSALFLTAIGILYGTFGTLDMADLSRRLAATDDRGVVTTLSMLFLVAFGIKSALFPLFFWLPASYHTPPFAVSGIFAGLLTKVGIYAIIRVFTLLFPIDQDFTRPLMLFLAAMTMLSGVLGAVSQQGFRRVLSFLIVSGIGFILLGLALGTRLALAGAVFYIVHDIIVKANLFFTAGLVERIRGTSALGETGLVSVYARAPMVTILFFVAAMSLAGIPPLSGFFAKLTLIRAGLEVEQWAVIGVALVASILTLYATTRIWSEAFWKGPERTQDEPEEIEAAPKTMVLPVAALALLTILIGLFAGPMFALADRAAGQLMDKQGYARAVLGEPGAAPAPKATGHGASGDGDSGHGAAGHEESP